MEVCGILKHSDMIDCFFMAKISSQSYPEVDPSFVKSYGDELSKSWIIMNNEGVHHDLIYNQIEIHPLIISGWPCIEAYYNLPSEVIVTMGYYGNNNFGILAFNSIVRPLDLPRFHNRNVLHKDVHVFDVALTPFSADLPTIKVNEEFGTILRDNGYEGFVMCGDNGKTKFMSILDNGDCKQTKLGYGWDEFCKSNQFEVGDIIRFKVDITFFPRICHVYLLR